jgi:LysM repeat protein
MYRDDETDAERKYPLDHKQVPSDESPASEDGQVSRRVRPAARPRPGTMRPLSAPQPLPVSSGTRRVPSYPDWEKPPSAFEYPRLRGQEVHRPLKPLLFAAVGVALIAGLIIAYSALTGHGGRTALASRSAGPSASLSSEAGGSGSASPNGSGSHAAAPSPSPQGTPTPFVSFRQYLVKSGDSATKIANKFGLKTWELIAANPQLTPPNYNLRVDSYLNIPLPGQMAYPTATPTPTVAPTPTPTLAAP